jgi:hypothetical protein
MNTLIIEIIINITVIIIYLKYKNKTKNIQKVTLVYLNNLIKIQVTKKVQ